MQHFSEGTHGSVAIEKCCHNDNLQCTSDDKVVKLVIFCFHMLNILNYITWSLKTYFKLTVGKHYCDVMMGAVASQITSPTIVYSNVYSDADQRKHQSSASLAFVQGIHRRPVNSLHKGPVMRKMFPFDDVIMESAQGLLMAELHEVGDKTSVVEVHWFSNLLPFGPMGPIGHDPYGSYGTRNGSHHWCCYS